MYFLVKNVNIKNKNTIGYKIGIPVEYVRDMNVIATILAYDFSISNFAP
jgi:hypothetical protein